VTVKALQEMALVWAVAVHDDLTVWAADSKGNTHVIDARMGLVMKRFRSPHAPGHAHLRASPPQHPHQSIRTSEALVTY